MNPQLPGRRSLARGFTLIELLTVIAIIAILAALLFPVMSAVRKNAMKTSCISNLHSISQALEMYKDDWRVYPEVLYGFSPPGQQGCPSFQPVAQGQPQPDLPELRLYPNYVKDRRAFTCPNSPAKQNFSVPINTVNATNMMTGQPNFRSTAQGPQVYCYWPWDSYDFQFRPDNVTTGTRELHYNRKWTSGPGSATDNSRQLIYREPPDSTVVTWCMYHSEMNAQTGLPGRGGMAMVLFLNGRVQTIPAERVATWNDPNNVPWLVTPKP
jgi:prepilin-type N-terminal cleavage/methylation domain-containing protein